MTRSVILASGSPRRRELLKKVIPGFRVVPSGVDEESFWARNPVTYALRAAVAKARAIGEVYPSSLVIAADTLVVLGSQIFGKPKNLAQARAMLQKLSGKKHKVITAVALVQKNKNRLLTGHETSWVTIKKLRRADIVDYLKKNDCLDKAGSYAIQEAGDTLVDKLEGDYDNVVGLSVRLVGDLFNEFIRADGSAR